MYTIIVDHGPSQEDNATIQEGLASFNESATGEPRDKEFSGKRILFEKRLRADK